MRDDCSCFSVGGADGGRDGGAVVTTDPGGVVGLFSFPFPFRVASPAYERFVSMTVMTDPMLSYALSDSVSFSGVAFPATYLFNSRISWYRPLHFSPSCLLRFLIVWCSSSSFFSFSLRSISYWTSCDRPA